MHLCVLYPLLTPLSPTQPETTCRVSAGHEITIVLQQTTNRNADADADADDATRVFDLNLSWDRHRHRHRRRHRDAILIEKN